MTFGLQRALWAVAFAGLIAGGATAALTISSEHMPHRGAMAAVGQLVTWSFIGAGLYAWWRRPGNRFGALMTAVGFS